MYIKNLLIHFLIILTISQITYANNNCPQWFPMPSSDGLVVVLPIYDASITKSDLDCDGIIDILDSDIDGDGVVNAYDAFPLNASESVDTDGDGIGNNADTDDDNDGFSDVVEIAAGSNPLDANDIPANETPKRIFIIGESTVHAGWWHSLLIQPADTYGDNRILEGWGEELDKYMKDPIKVYNRARSGSDTISYKTPVTDLPYANWPGMINRYWDTTEELINSTNDNDGGFLLIQYGGNDENRNTPEEFEAELEEYSNKAKALGLTPVFISPPARRSGTFNNRAYADLVEPVAKKPEVDAVFLDLFEKSKEVFQQYISDGKSISDIDEIFSYREHYRGINVAHFGRNGAKIVAGWIKELACDPTQHSDRSQAVRDAAVELCNQFVQGELEHNITMREDAEDGDKNNWETYGERAGSTITNIYDADKRSNVIVLQGDDGLNNGFVYNKHHTWAEENELVVSWEMNYAEDFTFFVSVETEDGDKFFEYKPTNDAGEITANGRYRFGLGANANDGTWHTFTRDIQADLKSLDPTKNILKIHRIAIRGSGSVDNIRTMRSANDVSRDIAPTVAIKGLMNIEVEKDSVYVDEGFTAVDDKDTNIATQVVTTGSVDTSTVGSYTIMYKVHDSVGNGGYAKRIVTVVDADAEIVVGHEDGNNAGWTVYDNNPAGATALSVEDADKGGRVIELSGAGIENGYALTNLNITEGFVASWAMKFDEDFKFFIKIQTQDHGRIYMTYVPEDIDRGYVEDGLHYVYLALGSDVNDNTWRTFKRDIAADLHKVKDEYVITSIIGFLVRGSGRVDDLTTYTRGNHATFTYNGHSYEIVKTARSWQEASNDAVAKGGYLAHINSKKENEEIYSRLLRHISDAELLTTRAADGGNASYVWIGGSDHTTEGTWRWSDDNVQFTLGDVPTAGVYTNWGQAWDGGHKEPDNWINADLAPEGQDFAAIAVHNPIKPGSNMGNGRNWPWGFAGQWNDVAIGNALYYIIEYN